MRGLWDDITSVFSSGADPQPVGNDNVTPVNSGEAYSPGTMLSSRYSVGSLSQTNFGLTRPNLPSTADQFNNMVVSANLLEELEQRVGPFTMISGFRTRELQNALSAAGEPTASGLSFHELGRGYDIAPTSMTPNEFFGKLLSIEDLKNQFAEIAIKNSQGSIHLATNVPSDMRTPKVLGLTLDNVYARLSLDDILAYISPFMPDTNTAVNYAEAQLVSYNRVPLYLALAGGLGLAAFVLMGSRRKA